MKKYSPEAIEAVKPPRWDVWKEELYPSVSKEVERVKRGPKVISKMMMAAFSDAFTDRFLEGMSLLDWGCGSGRYANFIHRRVEKFRYWGLEPSRFSDKFRNGTWSLFRDYPNMRFGDLGTDLEREAIASADVVLLMSVLTHLEHAEFARLIQEFSPILERGGVMVFSVLFGDSVGFGEEKLPGFADKGTGKAFTNRERYFREVWWTRAYMDQVVGSIGGLRLTHHGTWHGSRLPHQIFRLELESSPNAGL